MRNWFLQKTSVSETNASLTSGYNEVGFQLLRQSTQSGKDQNFLVSPLSVSTLLALTYNGAQGETQREIGNALGFATLSLNAINQSVLALHDGLSKTDSGVTLTTANSLWMRQEIPFNKLFLNIGKQYFKAQIQSLDFTSSQAVATINNWVNKQTHSKISQIIQELSPASAMLLVNAVYFKGLWQTQFKASRTQDSPFYLTAGETKMVPMMTRCDDFQYYEDESATEPLQVVSLPYGDGRLSLYLFLPSPKSSVDALIQNLASAKWNHWIRGMRKKEGRVSLPRFKMSYEADLVAPLQNLGVQCMFNPGADFSRISSVRPLYVSGMRHRAIIEVNEEGTEAAAVTMAQFAMCAPQPGDAPFEFTANRPFIGRHLR
jgi:serpin B